MSLLELPEIEKLELKIKALEAMTSAEFKIIFCKHAWLGIKRKASQLFKKYQLDQTKDRNSVLLLVVEKDREIAIVGDVGINEISPNEHWSVVRDAILSDFKREHYYVGLSTGLDLIASNLVESFPTDENNHNEVSNAIIFI